MTVSHAIPPPADCPLAVIPRLSYVKLAAGDSAEIDRLFVACRHTGFFYLDLQDHAILKNLDEQLAISSEMFDLPGEVKKAHCFKIDPVHGMGPKANLYTTLYKEPGLSIVDKKGNTDWSEFLSISTNEAFDETGTLPFNAPEVVIRKKQEVRNFISTSHEIITVLLRCTETSLGLEPGALTSLHTIGKSSTAQLRLTCAPPTDGVTPISLLAHSDASSFSLLFTQLSGLQILPPEAKTDAEWQWVAPLPNHAISNVGDSLRIFTNDLLISSRHRVVRSWGEEALHKRYSVVYLLRPDDEAIMTEVGKDGKPVPGDEKAVNARVWGNSKVLALIMGRGFLKDPTKKSEPGELFGT